jgi:hypothetical protein
MRIGSVADGDRGHVHGDREHQVAEMRIGAEADGDCCSALAVATHGSPK